MSNDIFDRVSQLIDQFQKQAGAGQTKEAFKLGDMSEYDVGKRVKPKDFILQKEMEDVLSDTMPNNPTVSSVEEGAEQDDVDNAYPNSPGVAVSTEDGPEVDEVRQPLGGEEAMKDASVSRLSDGELLDKLASATYQLLYNYAMIEPTKTLIKSGAFSKDDVAAFTVADIVKQADYDADLVVGFLSSFLKTAEDAATAEAATAATDPNLEDMTTEGVVPDADAAAVEEDPAAVLAEATPEEIAEVLQEEPELAAALAGGVAEEDPLDVLNEASPEEVAEVLQSDPELAASVAEALDSVEGAPVEEAAKEAAFRKWAEDMAAEEDPAAVLADASPEEIAEVIQEDPELAAAVAGGVAEDDPVAVLADASPEEIAEVLQEEPELAAALTDAVGGADVGVEPGAGMETPAEEAMEGHEGAAGSEEAGGEETPEEEAAEEKAKEAAILPKIAALSRVMAEEQISPEELTFYASSGPKARDAVKVANAVRNFRNKYRGRNVKEADSPRLKEHMRQFLQELLTG